MRPNYHHKHPSTSNAKENSSREVNTWKGVLTRRKGCSRMEQSEQIADECQKGNVEEYMKNKAKLDKLSSKLDEMYRHFQTQNKRLEGKRKIQEISMIQMDKKQPQVDIRKANQLLQPSMLKQERAKLSYLPFL